MADKKIKIQDYFISENDPKQSADFLQRANRVNLEQGHNHKVIWPFLILSILIVVFGFRFMYGNIKDSVAYDLPDWVEEQVNQETDAEEIAKLQEEDTDHDGLTNYQEIYQYHTSMFLADTDSDGYSDYEEVTSGNDPVCPSGENCNLLKLITPKTKISKVIEDVNIDPNLSIQDAALAEFKKFLLDNGMTQEELDSLSDEELLGILVEVGNPEGIPSEFVDSETTPDQIRNFLLSQPDADETEINSLTDEELLQIRDILLNP